MQLKPNVLAFEHINSKLKFRLQQCSNLKTGLVKLLAILKQKNQVSLETQAKIKFTAILIHFESGLSGDFLNSWVPLGDFLV
jgi:hypothetical protein